MQRYTWLQVHENLQAKSTQIQILNICFEAKGFQISYYDCIRSIFLDIAVQNAVLILHTEWQLGLHYFGQGGKFAPSIFY